MAAVVTALHRYPVKGFSPETLDAVDLAVGETMPFDRAFAIENGPSGFDPAAPAHLPKIRFLCLMKNESLARLVTRFDAPTCTFTLAERSGEVLCAARLDTDDGRAALQAFVARHFAADLRGAPRLLAAPGHSFSDVAKKVLHLISTDTLAAMSEKLGAPLDPVRFRPNLVVDGLAPYAELDWPSGRIVTIGAVDFEVVKRTERCAATNVDPATGVRDQQIPRFLMGLLGHTDCGVYLRVASPGRIAVGDPLTP